LQIWSWDDEQKHVLMMCSHHSITDGMSVELMQRELAAAYHAIVKGAQPTWLPLPVQYHHYAAWQRLCFANSSTWRQQLEYWQQALSGLPELQLQADRPRPALLSGKAAGVPLRIDAATVQRLKALAASAHTTLFCTLLAVLQVGRHRGFFQSQLQPPHGRLVIAYKS
jgi:Condensation domain